MEEQIRILGFTGSLRKNSYNLAALRAARQLLNDGAELEIIDLTPIPFFNEDLEAEGVPQVVADFKKRIAEADALLIATPEYNYSIPPVLKNALDWASRENNPVLRGKPVGIMSASPSIFGGARAQYHLRQVCVVLDLLPLNKPEVFIINAHTKFDEKGNLTDDRSRTAIDNLMRELVKWARMLKKKEETG